MRKPVEQEHQDDGIKGRSKRIFFYNDAFAARKVGKVVQNLIFTSLVTNTVHTAVTTAENADTVMYLCIKCMLYKFTYLLAIPVHQSLPTKADLA